MSVIIFVYILPPSLPPSRYGFLPGYAGGGTFINTPKLSFLFSVE